jgi:hypothetical protein
MTHLEGKTCLINECLRVVLIELVNEHFTASEVLSIKFNGRLQFQNLKRKASLKLTSRI